MIENVLGRLKDGDAALPAPPALSPSPSLTPRDIKAKYSAAGGGAGAGAGGESRARLSVGAPASRPRSRRASCALECGALALPLPGVAANVLQPTADVLQKLSTLLVPGGGEEDTGGGGGGDGCTLTVPRARPRASIDLGSFCKGRGGRSPRRMRGASEADVLHYERRYGYGAAASPSLAAPAPDSPLLLSTEVSATEDEDTSDMELVVQSTRIPPRATPSPSPSSRNAINAASEELRAVPVAGGWRRPAAGCCILS